MFRKAYALASKFTQPVVLSRKDVAGNTSSMIGTYVILNDEGWILTAAHITTAFKKMADERLAIITRPTSKAAIEADASLSAKERYDAIKALGKTKPNDTENCSAWWGQNGATLAIAHAIEAVDLCVAKLDNLDVTAVTNFPLIRNPAKPIEPGASLCRLGFPFHSIAPTWDAAGDKFVFPPGALPMPFFPIEGILTREAQFETPTPQPFPLKWIETSSPGLKGQSGGPIFDVEGTLWGIQVQTAHLPLGFDPDVPGGGGRKEHQFLNVGLGVHYETLCSGLDNIGVRYEKET